MFEKVGQIILVFMPCISSKMIIITLASELKTLYIIRAIKELCLRNVIVIIGLIFYYNFFCHTSCCNK